MDGIHPKMYFPSAKRENAFVDILHLPADRLPNWTKNPDEIFTLCRQAKKKPFETKESDHPFSNQFSIRTSLIRRA